MARVSQCYSKPFHDPVSLLCPLNMYVLPLFFLYGQISRTISLHVPVYDVICQSIFKLPNFGFHLPSSGKTILSQHHYQPPTSQGQQLFLVSTICLVASAFYTVDKFLFFKLSPSLTSKIPGSPLSSPTASSQFLFLTCPFSVCAASSSSSHQANAGDSPISASLGSLYYLQNNLP